MGTTCCETEGCVASGGGSTYIGHKCEDSVSKKKKIREEGREEERERGREEGREGGRGEKVRERGEGEGGGRMYVL